MYILFLDDWAKYPTATMHVETKNTTWVRQSAVYKKMGIKNHAFLLALVDPRLRHVDPHDENITPELAALVAQECTINPWYFFREVARIPAQAGAAPRPLRANRGNISLFWSFFNHITFILQQPRQTGKSVASDVLTSCLLDVLCRNTQINLMTKDDTLRRKNIERIKEIRECLPKYLYFKLPTDANNTEEITVKARGNSYIAHVPQSSEKRAYNMGRGLTSPIFFIDEAPFQSNIAVSLPAALAAGGAAREIADASGNPWGTIITTTSGKKDDRDGKYVYKLVQAAAIWTDTFYDAPNLSELVTLVKRNSPGGVLRINAAFSHRQLGYTDEWMEKTLNDAIAEGDDANRDYFNVWTSGNESSPLTVEQAEAITDSIKEIKYNQIASGGYMIRWYVSEEEIPLVMSHPVILNMDPSEAIGSDDISFVLQSVYDLSVIAAATFNETNLIMFSKFICEFLVKYKNVTCVIERRSTGSMIIDYLLLMLPQYGEDPFKRLYNRAVQDADENKDRYREISTPMSRRNPDVYVKYKKLFGFSTSGSGATARGELYGNTMQLALKRAADKVHDQKLASQLLGLVNRNGRIDHAEGEHDDMVIAWLLSNWFLTKGKYLAHYGIETNTVGVGLEEAKVVSLSPADLYYKNLQTNYRKRITEIYELLKRERDQYVAERLEAELRHLDRQLVLEDGEIFSVEELLSNLKNRKQRRIREKASSYAGNHGTGSPTGISYFSDTPFGR